MRRFEADSACVWCGTDTTQDAGRAPAQIDFTSSFLSVEMDAKFFDQISGYGCSTCLRETEYPDAETPDVVRYSPTT